jgi:hypothetical protein
METVMTLDEIGKQFGVTRERIRQIEKRALAKIAQRLEHSQLTLEDLITYEQHKQMPLAQTQTPASLDRDYYERFY